MKGNEEQMDNKERSDFVAKVVSEVSNGVVIDYEDLPTYDLFLSQVVLYLNDKCDDDKFTQSIIQNYMKNEVIMKTDGGKKRGYTRDHIAQLLLLSYMRPILSTDEIKKVFNLVLNNVNDENDNIISLEESYRVFSEIQKECFDDFINIQNINKDKFYSIIKNSSISSKDEEKVSVFILVMTLIAEATAMKKIAKKIIDTYPFGE